MRPLINVKLQLRSQLRFSNKEKPLLRTREARNNQLVADCLVKGKFRVSMDIVDLKVLFDFTLALKKSH